MDMIEAVARAWASIDGKLDAFEREREGMDYDDPKYTGHYEGYLAEAKELLARSGLEDIQSYKTAALTVLAAVREYLPPDGISKDELISRVIEAVDNPEFNEGLHKPRVTVKPLEWEEATNIEDHSAWRAETIVGTYEVGFDDGWYSWLNDGAWEWQPENDCRTYYGPSAGQAAAQIDYERRILSAIET